MAAVGCRRQGWRDQAGYQPQVSHRARHPELDAFEVKTSLREPVLSRAVRIFEAFTAEETTLGASEIAWQAGAWISPAGR